MKSEMFKYRLLALAVIALGFLSVLPEGDWTACVFCLMLGVPTLFAKKEWLD